MTADQRAARADRLFGAHPAEMMALAAAVSVGPLVVRGRSRHIRWGWVAVSLAGYATYAMTRRYRERERAGPPGFEYPPDRLLTTGPYAFSRNPMYVGQLVYLAGLVLATRSPIAMVFLVRRALRLGAQVQIDEERLERLFGEQYRAYRGRVPRWLPLPSSVP